MKLLTIALFVLIVFSGTAFGQQCDYYDYEYHTEIVEQIHDSQTNEVLGPSLIIEDFRTDSDKYPSFRIWNTLDRQITIEVVYDQIVSGRALHKPRRIVNISANDFIRLRGDHGYNARYNTHIDPESVSYTLIDPAAIVSKDRVNVETPVCKKCNFWDTYDTESESCSPNWIIFAFFGIIIAASTINYLWRGYEKERQRTIKMEADRNLNHTEKWKKRYGNKIKEDGDGYFIFTSSGIRLHRYLYENNCEPLEGNEEVHHIDANKHNNELWNLVKLTQEEHRKINHGRIHDWKSGIEELIRVVGLKKMFPKEVTKRIKEEI